MRQIKFRAWDKKNKRMGDVEQISFYHVTPPHVLLVRFKDNKQDSIQNFELMQFTGLKDCKDKEIYEGDLLQSLPNGMEPREILQVVWDKSMFELQSKDGKYITPIYPVGDQKIIGNIYENPELLK